MKRPIQLLTTCGSAAVAVAASSGPCFVQPRRVASSSSTTTIDVNHNIFHHEPTVFRHRRQRSSFHHGHDMSRDSHDDEYNNDDEEEEDYDDLQTNLNKISWLPSVTLGKQPYHPSFTKSESRRESDDQDRYEAATTAPSPPPGFENIDILPVLPMNMVHGLDGFLMNNDDQDGYDTLDAISSADEISSMNYKDDYLGLGLTSM